jgi:arylsulfatase A-like enzyme
MMQVGRGVVILLVLFVGCSVDSLYASPGGKPNIVFVLVDDLRWDDLGCTGAQFVESPGIDRVASEGAIFRNAFSTTPLCSPSRASILTGQYAHTHGIVDNLERGPQSHKLATFPQELQKAGYETAYMGKWHMGNDNTPRPGFDDWFCLKGQGTSFDSEANENGKPVQTKGYVTDVLNARALEFVKRPHEKPFMLYLSHKAIHPETAQGPDGKLSDPSASNFIPAPRHEKLYEGVKVARRPSAEVPPTDKPALQQKLPGLPPLGPETGSKDSAILNRLRMLASVDEGVGQLLDALAESGELNNTLFVVAGDHGYFYGEHGLSTERRLAYEEAARVPLIMRYPKLIAAKTAPEALVQVIDLAPTFVEVAGGAIPSPYQGRSLVPLMQGETPADWRDAVLLEYWTDTVFPRVHQMGYQAVRTERWKYIRYVDLEGADELYDLESDPYEVKNLISDPAAADELATMKSKLEELLAESGGELR